MKKRILIALVAIAFIGCRKVDIPTIINQVPSELAINSVSGIKLESPFVT